MKLLSALLFFFQPAFAGPSAFAPNPVEEELARLATAHGEQKRAKMVYDPILNYVARKKAEDLGKRNYFSHVDPDGFGPNRALQLAGLKLPQHWGTEKSRNNIESIAAGYSSAGKAFAGWMKSPGHRDHVLGQDSFYAQQTRYGFGYAEVPGSEFKKYYVFISIPEHPENRGAMEPYTRWLFENFPLSDLQENDDESDHDGDGIGRLMEFALGFDPFSPETMATPRVNPAARELLWELPLIPDLGSVRAIVEQSSDMKNWHSYGISKVETGFSISLESRSFMRLRLER